MDHQTALSVKAAEQYSLGELTSPQREEFEAHFFECQECAAALKEYEIFAANARAVFQEDPLPRRAPQPASPGWLERLRDWFGLRTLLPAAAALAFALLLMVHPWAPTPDPNGPTSSFVLAAEVRSGETRKLTIKPGTVWVELQMDLVAGLNPNRWASYHWEVEPLAGGPVASQGDRANQTPGTMTLKLPASKLESGKPYKLLVQGAAGTDPLESVFLIERQ